MQVEIKLNNNYYVNLGSDHYLRQGVGDGGIQGGMTFFVNMKGGTRNLFWQRGGDMKFLLKKSSKLQFFARFAHKNY